ncbi:hypothetical protein VPNG_04927 [Cytospora leucostoma]|uniref:Uncharacterized protein n=1 Tax=Cytospora leucostoma TaxID=1230097 RepID=A0A423X7A7_9PEZI|nr:hypothetical protein VPNG_04927 [Cytospora leucostoma]
MVLKAFMRLAAVVIRALQFRRRLPSVYNTTPNAFARQQRKVPVSSLAPSTRWTAVSIASLIAIWFFWGLLHGQRKVNHTQKVGHVKVQPIGHAISSHSGSLHSKPDALSIIADAHQAGISDRPLILYAYAESENALTNLKFFLSKGLHGRADFVFIFNGAAPEAVRLIPKVLPNVKVVQRGNTCYDIGAYGEVLRSQIKFGKWAKEEDGIPLWKRYKKFITINASIRGPFLPVWSDECWTDAILRKVTHETKLVGLSYHCNPAPHLQSMLLATDHIGMSILLDPALAYSVPASDPPHGTFYDPVGFSKCYSDFNKAVHSEIGMARLIRSQGYKVDAMLTSVHILGAAEYCERAAWPTDHLWDGMYFGFNVHPYEMLFMKANRDIDPELVKRFTEWHLRDRSNSWDTCGE